MTNPQTIAQMVQIKNSVPVSVDDSKIELKKLLPDIKQLPFLKTQTYLSYA